MGLSSESHNLLASILKEQKAESIPYQVVNNLNDNKPVDKVVSQFEDILFSEFNPEFDQKEEAAVLKIIELEEKGEKVDKEIEELSKKYNQKLLDEQTKLETNVATLVTALKTDLRTPGGGRKFFELLVEEAEISSKVKYTPTEPEGSDYYGSIIKTGYTKDNK